MPIALPYKNTNGKPVQNQNVEKGGRKQVRSTFQDMRFTKKTVTRTQLRLQRNLEISLNLKHSYKGTPWHDWLITNYLVGVATMLFLYQHIICRNFDMVKRFVLAKHKHKHSQIGLALCCFQVPSLDTHPYLSQKRKSLSF